MEAESAEWFLDVQGRRIGPFTASQVIGFYQDGEVLAAHRASTTPDDDASWISVEDLARSFEAGSAQAEVAVTAAPEPSAPVDVEAPKGPAVGPQSSLLKQGGVFRPPQRPPQL